MNKIELFKKTYEVAGLTSGLMYEMFAEYNGGQIELELFTTTSSGKKIRSILRGVTDFIITENINGQDVVRVIWKWIASKLKGSYYLTNYRAASFTKHQGEFLEQNPNHDQSMILLVLDEDEDEAKADPNTYKVVRVDFIDANDPNYLPYDLVVKGKKNS